MVDAKFINLTTADKYASEKYTQIKSLRRRACAMWVHDEIQTTLQYGTVCCMGKT